jgi:hypothetical protein
VSSGTCYKITVHISEGQRIPEEKLEEIEAVVRKDFMRWKCSWPQGKEGENAQRARGQSFTIMGNHRPGSDFFLP